MTKNGLVVDEDGWFVMNARESRWKDEGPLGSYCTFEGKRRFRQLGINISVLGPGQALGRYHRENAQEAFLVVAGECILIVEEQERLLGRLGLLPLPRRHGTHHRRGERGAGDRRRRRRPRPGDRGWPRLPGLAYRRASPCERGTRDDEPGRGVRDDPRGATPVDVRPLPGRLAARRAVRIGSAIASV